MTPGQAIEPGLGFDERGNRDRRVVHQPLADPGDVRDNLDPEIAQMAGRAYTGAQQMRRRVDCPRRDDHLPAGLTYAELGLLAVDQRLDADATRPLEQQLLDLRQRPDRQIVAPAGPRIEIADRRRA